jgi:hypothetical protein
MIQILFQKELPSETKMYDCNHFFKGDDNIYQPLFPYVTYVWFETLRDRMLEYHVQKFECDFVTVYNNPETSTDTHRQIFQYLVMNRVIQQGVNITIAHVSAEADSTVFQMTCYGTFNTHPRRSYPREPKDEVYLPSRLGLPGVDMIWKQEHPVNVPIYFFSAG